MTEKDVSQLSSGGDIWLEDKTHRSWLARDALVQFEFFRASADSGPGFRVLDREGQPTENTVQELHTTTRLIHSYCLGKLAGVPDCDEIIDTGMAYLRSHHRDHANGGYLWAFSGDTAHDDRKLAYGHVFVLLASATAKMAGHPDADQLIDDASQILSDKFWEETSGLFADEFSRDWSPFSTYRGVNSNMHGVEALLAAYEATGREIYIDRAGSILDFFTGQIAPKNNWRIPEHYDQNWMIDRDYSGNPMFRPAGTTPGHSFELARLLLQYWDLSGRKDDAAPIVAREITEQALADAWDPQNGGLCYTLGFDGRPSIRDRYWWPVTEAIGTMAALIKIERRPTDEAWYRKLWDFAFTHFVDHEDGGWHPEIDSDGQPTARQFHGKPDIYHALQAELFPLAPGISNQAQTLPRIISLLDD